MLSGTQNARGFNQLKAERDADDVALTMDNGMQAALDVSATFLRRADEMFAKEQEHIVQQEFTKSLNDSAPEMFVDKNG